MGTIDKENNNIGDKRSGSDRRVSADPNYTGRERRVNEERRSGIDKRKQKRFQVKDGSFAVLSYNPPIVGQMINMSMNGLAVRYTSQEKVFGEPNEIDMLRPGVGFYLNKLQVKTIKEYKLSGEIPSGSKNVWQRHMQFSELSNDQLSRLDHFIKNYTVIMRSGRDRRQFQDPLYSGPEMRSGIERRS